jgi:trimethylamine--corrinoid protein Co-methyltransferase
MSDNKTTPDFVNKYRVLTSENIKKIHAGTLELLEDLGVTVMHEKGLDILSDAGAKVDRKTRNVKIPAHIVEKCIHAAPKSFVMAGRDPENDLTIDMGGKIFSRNGGGPGHVEDMDSHQVRNATLADVKDYARLVDAIDNIEIAAPIYAQDTPPQTRDIRVLAAMFASTTKHINMRLLHLSSLPYVIRMAEIVAGGKENLKKRPVITMLESPIAPLKIPDVLVETLFLCGEYGIPLEICSMPIAGATGPITLAGSLLMSNVEMVTAIVLSQLVHPGAPLVFTPRIMVMNMRNGHALTGSIENALLAAAGVQLAREAYQIPVNMHGPYTDSIISDTQASMEDTYFTMLPALAGANILTGAGHLEGGLFVSYTQLMVDSEITGVVQRAVQGFEVDANSLALDAIKRSVINQNLLTDPHTMANLRAIRVYKPKLLTREPRQTWLNEGSKTMEQRAREMARTLLATHETIPLEPFIQKELDQVIVGAAVELET